MSLIKPQQALANVLCNPAIWRARQHRPNAAPGLTTGHVQLDRLLPDGGWPQGALTELLVRTTGIGELSFLLPTLRAACAQGRGVALLAPPWLPQARAWEAAGIALEQLLIIAAKGNNLLWAAEQTLRSGECAAVILWSETVGRSLTYRMLQRLQLAAVAGNALCLLYRSATTQTEASPAPLRLLLAAQRGALYAQILKCRGVVPNTTVPLTVFPSHWQAAGTRRDSKASSSVALPRRLPGALDTTLG